MATEGLLFIQRYCIFFMLTPLSPRFVTIVHEPQLNEIYDEKINKFSFFSAIRLSQFSENKPTFCQKFAKNCEIDFLIKIKSVEIKYEDGRKTKNKNRCVCVLRRAVGWGCGGGGVSRQARLRHHLLCKGGQRGTTDGGRAASLSEGKAAHLPELSAVLKARRAPRTATGVSSFHTAPPFYFVLPVAFTYLIDSDTVLHQIEK